MVRGAAVRSCELVPARGTGRIGGRRAAAVARRASRFPTARGEVRRARVRRFPSVIFSLWSPSVWSRSRCSSGAAIRGSGRSAAEP